MEKLRKGTAKSTAMEENTMVMLEALGTSNTSHLHNDRLTFLQAVRTASIFPENSVPPTCKMWEAILGILRKGKSIELIMESYLLLMELEKRFPRVYLSNGDRNEPHSSNSSELVIEEAWSPFTLGSEAASSGTMSNKQSAGSIDIPAFHHILQGLAEEAYKTEPQSLNIELIRKMLLLQYLVNVLEGDFLPRKRAYIETKEWTILRDSLLNRLASSRRINYKGVVQDCLLLMSTHSGFSCDPREVETSCNDTTGVAMALAFPELGRRAVMAVKNLLVMMIDLDSSRKKADDQGLTTRADGVRTPAMEIILDELTYNKDTISFLQVFDEPKLKLEIVLQYFKKYATRPSVRTRKSKDSSYDTTIVGVLKSFSDTSTIKSIIKKIGVEEVQVLLAHALQACMSLTPPQLVEAVSDSTDDIQGNPLLEICRKIIEAFKSLKNADGRIEILALGKETLFVAATILSVKS